MPGNYPLESGEDEAHAPRATLSFRGLRGCSVLSVMQTQKPLPSHRERIRGDVTLHALPRRARLAWEVIFVKLKRLKERYVVDEHGHKTAVVLDLKEYQEMLDWLETLEDTLDLDEAVRQARRFRDYREIRQELQKAGRL